MDILCVGCHRVGNADVLDSYIPDVPVAVSSKSNRPIRGRFNGYTLRLPWCWEFVHLPAEAWFIPHSVVNPVVVHGLSSCQVSSSSQPVREGRLSRSSYIPSLLRFRFTGVVGNANATAELRLLEHAVSPWRDISNYLKDAKKKSGG